MIQFFTDGVEMPQISTGLISRWISEVARLHGKHTGALSYIFCNDEKILEVNRQFLQHDYYTDIITFSSGTESTVSGDMFISLDTVRTNAEGLSVRYEDELLRVIIHGILHLCGINDKGPGEREIMQNEEDSALQILRALQE